jgi:methionyl-tRNA formyltransferase
MSASARGDNGALRIAFAGSGAFGAPTLRALAARGDAAPGEVVLVVSAPARPAGRGLAPTPTPIARAAETLGLPLLETADINAPESVARLAAAAPAVLVVIAFGQKLSPEVVSPRFSINLHASLLPRHRGAAPIQRALMAGDTETGLCVISLAPRMDAGAIHATRRVAIDPRETAAELHDRLAELGPEVVLEAIEAWRCGRLRSIAQEEAAATRAPKIGRADARIDFARPAEALRGWIHGLSPRPGCTLRVGDSGAAPLRLLRVEAIPQAADGAPGTLDPDGVLHCAEGSRLRLLEVQPAGGRAMTWAEWGRGHPIQPGTPVHSP